MESKEIVRTTFKTIISLSIGFVLLWLIYRKMDLNDILEVMRTGVRYDILIGSLFFGLAANIMRAIRWKLLINAMGEKPRTINIIWAVLGNYTINLILPRMGEVWRCAMIKKYDKISFTKLIGTLLVDRVSDVVAIGFITLMIMIFNIQFFTDFFHDNPNLMDGFIHLIQSPWLYIVTFGLCIFIYMLFRYMGHLSFIVRIKAVLKDVYEGFYTIIGLKHKEVFIIETILIWVGYFIFFYSTFYAFSFTKDLGIVVGLITFTMGSIAIAVPVQGGIGPWHFMVIASLVLFGVDPNEAAAFALIVHTTQTLWTTLVGLVGVVALPMMNEK